MPKKQASDETQLELLVRVNRLNMLSDGPRYWTCTVLYNTVVWRQAPGEEATMHEVLAGVPREE